MLAGGAAIALPLEATAEAGTSMPLVGFLGGHTPAAASVDLLASFHRGLAEAGFASGKNVAIEYRWAEGQHDRLPGLGTRSG